MTLKCGWASQGESGYGTMGGQAGNQTGSELKVGDWYNFDQNYVIRWKDRNEALKYASIIYSICTNKNVGYDQGQRTTLYNELQRVGWDPTKIENACETDCSALVGAAIRATGIKQDGLSYMSTYTMVDTLKKTDKFYFYTGSKYTASTEHLMIGDIIVNTNRHVITSLGDGSSIDGGLSEKEALEATSGLLNANVDISKEINTDGNFKMGKLGSELIKEFEGCRLEAYQDSGGIWTIGWGHTDKVDGKSVGSGMKISQEKADSLLYTSLAGHYSKQTNEYCPFAKKLNHNQFDALVSICYNCGPGGLQNLCKGQTADTVSNAIEGFYVRDAAGNYLEGLVRRRKAEKALYDSTKSNYAIGTSASSITTVSTTDTGDSSDDDSSDSGLNLGLIGIIKSLLSGIASAISALSSISMDALGEKPNTSVEDHLKKALDIYNVELDTTYDDIQKVNYSTYKGMNLLTSASWVESPFIIAKIGDYTFGSYESSGTINKKSDIRITFPNFIQSMTVTKTNGTLNQYELDMVYAITPGDDPNLIDKILGTVANSRTIVFTYGDWCAPSFIFKEEEAIITKVTSNISFATGSQKITYHLSCVSKALKATANTFDFPARTAKGSDVIKELLNNSAYGLQDVFPGMVNVKTDAKKVGLIASDDKEVHLETQLGVDPLTYLNYVVDSMSATTSDSASAIKDSTYHLIIQDDISRAYGGTYFKVVKISTSTKSLTSADIYEIDVGFSPTDYGNALITSFSINTDNEWGILYEYANKIEQPNYVYRINDDGKIYSDRVDSKGTSSYYNRVSETNKTWWTKMTQYPVTATLTVKGLLRPAILMTYIRINSYFYGAKHLSSGVYAITKQVDSISGNGYRTTLSLTRIAED